MPLANKTEQNIDKNFKNNITTSTTTSRKISLKYHNFAATTMAVTVRTNKNGNK